MTSHGQAVMESTKGLQSGQTLPEQNIQCALEGRRALLEVVVFD